MRPTFQDTMKQLGMQEIHKRFWRKRCLTLKNREFLITLTIDKKNILVNVNEYGTLDLMDVKPIKAQYISNDDNAGLAVFYLLATTFMEQHLFKEFNQYVYDTGTI